MVDALVQGVEQQTGSDDSASRDTPAGVDFIFRGEGAEESSGMEMKMMPGGSRYREKVKEGGLRRRKSTIYHLFNPSGKGME